MSFSTDNTLSSRANQTATAQSQADLAEKLSKRGVAAENIETIAAVISNGDLNPQRVNDLSQRSLNRIASDAKIKKLKPHETVEEAHVVSSPKEMRDAANHILKLVEKDGEMWECIGVEKNPGGGNIFSFTLHDEFNPLKKGNKESEVNKNVKEKKHEIYPADEPDLGQTQELLCNSRFSLFDEDFHNFLNELGLSFEIKEDENSGFWASILPIHPFFIKQNKPILKLPDAEALSVNLERKYPHLEKFNIFKGESIESDLAFAEAFYSGHDLVLSSGKEFIHDFLIHGLIALSFLWRGQKDKSLGIEERRRILTEKIELPLNMIRFNKEKLQNNEITK